MEDLTIETDPRQNDGTRILRITGPLTLKTLFDFQNALRLDAAGVTIIDLSAVPYIDSAALGSLLGFHVSCAQKGRRYALAGATPRLESIFKVTRVDAILLRFPTVEDAEKALHASAASATDTRG
jgi:anti-sigma B factor antagonist